jgi:hypothetical protein
VFTLKLKGENSITGETSHGNCMMLYFLFIFIYSESDIILLLKEYLR